MELRHSKTGNPLFHTIDMDRKQEGPILQYSHGHTEEAETTIHTLIIVLEYFNPLVDV